VIDLPRPRTINTLKEADFGRYTTRIREYFYRPPHDASSTANAEKVTPLRRTVA
jgi:NitT/TauT family transport system ATP-binding protein